WRAAHGRDFLRRAAKKETFGPRRPPVCSRGIFAEGASKALLGATLFKRRVLPVVLPASREVVVCGFGSGPLRVARQATARLRTELTQQLQSLRGQRAGEDGHASDVATRPIEARDEAELDRIATDDEHDRYG